MPGALTRGLSAFRGGGGTIDQILRLRTVLDAAGLDQAKAKIDEVDKHAEKSGKGMSGLQKGLLGVAGVGFAGLVAGLGASAATAADFQKNLNGVAAATGASQSELAAMRKEALAVGRDTSKSASEAVVAFGELAKAGVAVKDIVAGVGRTTVQLAEATGTAIPQMATLMADTLNIWKLSADQAASVADTLAKTAVASTVDIGDLQQAISNVGPVAASLGVSVRETAAALGILGNNGIKGAEAGTALRGMLLRLTAPTNQAKAILDDLGVAVFDAQGKMRPLREVLIDLNGALEPLTQEERTNVMKEIFDTYTITAGTALIHNAAQQWDDFNAAIDKSPGVAEQSQKRMEGLAGAMERLRGSLETAAITIGTALLPALTAMVSAAERGLNWLMAQDYSGAVGALNQVSDILGTIAATVADRLAGPMRATLGWLADHPEALIGAAAGITAVAVALAAAAAAGAAFGLITSPLTLIIAAAAALGAGIVLLARNWDDLTAKVPALGPAVDSVMVILRGLTDLITGPVADGLSKLAALAGEVAGGLIDAFNDPLGFLRDHWPEVATLIAGPFAPIVSLATDAFGVRTALTGAFGAIWEYISTEVPGWPGKIRNFLASLPDLVCDVVKDAGKAIAGAFGSAWGWLSGEIPSWPGRIKDSLAPLVGALCDIGKAAGSGFVRFLTGNLDITAGLSWIWGKVKGFVGLVNDLLEKLHAPAIGIGDMGAGGGGPPQPSAADVAIAALAPISLPAAASAAAIKCFGAGGDVDGATLSLLGETGFREYVISTDPRHRGANLARLARAAGMLGVNQGGPLDWPGDLIGSIGNMVKAGAARLVAAAIERLGIDFGNQGLVSDLGRGVFGAVKDAAVGFVQGLLDKAREEGGTFRRPLSAYTVTQEFGENPQVYGPGGHTGIDLAAPVGTPIMASAGGDVGYAGWLDPRGSGGYGNAVILQHLENLSTLYGHMSTILTRVGAAVTGGEGIGQVGSTGFSTGPHLHFEVRRGNVPVNPRSMVQLYGGGFLTEPVMGIGLLSGTAYALAERGPEAVVPLSGAGGRGGAGIGSLTITAASVTLAGGIGGMPAGFAAGVAATPVTSQQQQARSAGSATSITQTDMGGGLVKVTVSLDDGTSFSYYTLFGRVLPSVGTDEDAIRLAGYAGLTPEQLGRISAEYRAIADWQRAGMNPASPFGPGSDIYAAAAARVRAQNPNAGPDEIDRLIAIETRAAADQANAARAQQEAAQTQADAASVVDFATQSVSTSANVIDFAASAILTGSTNIVDMAKDDAERAAELEQLRKDAADALHGAADQQQENTADFGTHVDDFGNEVDTFGNVVEGGAAEEADTATMQARRARWEAEHPGQTAPFARGGFIRRPTWLVDIASGSLYGTMAEAGTGGEYIVPRGDMARMRGRRDGGAGAAPVYTTHNTYLLANDPAAIAAQQRLADQRRAMDAVINYGGSR